MQDLLDHDGVPSLLKGMQMRNIDELDEYLDELRRRIDDA